MGQPLAQSSPLGSRETRSQHIRHGSTCSTVLACPARHLLTHQMQLLLICRQLVHARAAKPAGGVLTRVPNRCTKGFAVWGICVQLFICF
jgi:hypothetical protein